MIDVIRAELYELAETAQDAAFFYSLPCFGMMVLSLGYSDLRLLMSLGVVLFFLAAVYACATVAACLFYLEAE